MALLGSDSRHGPQSIALKILALYGPLAGPALPRVAALAEQGRWSVQASARQALAAIQGTTPPPG
jgi:hypothetical protein